MVFWARELSLNAISLHGNSDMEWYFIYWGLTKNINIKYFYFENKNILTVLTFGQAAHNIASYNIQHQKGNKPLPKQKMIHKCATKLQ